MSSGPISNSWRASLTWSSAPNLHALHTLLPPQLPVFWWIFASIRASFPLTNLSGRGVIFLSGNPVPQPLLPTCYCSLDTALTHILLPLGTPTRESSILSSPLTFFHAHVSSTLKEDTWVLIASFRSHSILCLLSSRTSQICSLYPQSPFTFL